MYSSIHWMKEMRAAHNATRPRQVARAPQRRRSARKAPCRGGAPPSLPFPVRVPLPYPSSDIAGGGGGGGAPAASRTWAARSPSASSLVLIACRAWVRPRHPAARARAVPTVAPTRVPTVHSLPPSLSALSKRQSRSPTVVV
jgi:hypothetical protein